MKERAEVTDTDASQSRNALSNRIHNKIKNPKSDTNRKRHPPPLIPMSASKFTPKQATCYDMRIMIKDQVRMRLRQIKLKKENQIKLKNT
jgi:hypothetical protein